LVDKLIREKITELFIVITFVIISVPVWKTFNEKISQANITTLSDYKVIFALENNNYLDKITVYNEYYINKFYTISLVTSKTVDEKNSIIYINGNTYNLNDFKKEVHKNNHIYTLVNDYIIANSIDYDIRPVINNDNYSYLFEEKTI